MGVKRLSLVTVLVGAALAAAQAVDPAADVASLEVSMAERIEPIVKEITGASKVWVWVKIQPDIEKWQAFLKTLTPPGKGAPASRPAAAFPRTPDILPGVTTDEMAGILKGREQSIANRAGRASADRGRNMDYDAAVKMASWFQRVSVRIGVPESVPPDRLKDLKTKLPLLLGLQFQQGDTLVVQTIPLGAPMLPDATVKPKTFQKRLLEWLSQMTPNMAALWVLLATAIFFLFGPIRAFLRDAAVAMQLIRVQSQTSGRMERHNSSADETGKKPDPLDALPGSSRLALGGGASPVLEGEAQEVHSKPVSTQELFAFVTEEVMPNLIQICQEEPPEHVAMLTSYIKPAWAGRIFSSLSPEKRQEVLKHFSQRGRFDPQDVTTFAKRLESTISFVSGGPERLLDLMEEMEPGTRNAVLLELDRLLPETARIIRSRMISYIDLFRINAKDLQKLLWEAYRSKISLPILIASVPPKGQLYLIKQLPESVAAVIQEETKAAGTPSNDRVEEEGRRLLQLARGLAKTGEIGPVDHRAGEAA